MGTNKNDCCYPVIIDDVSQKQFCEPGLTKREYFSALAMQQLIGKIFGHVYGHDVKGNCADAIQCAELAVKYADALINELNKTEETNNV